MAVQKIFLVLASIVMLLEIVAVPGIILHVKYAQSIHRKII